MKLLFKLIILLLFIPVSYAISSTANLATLLNAVHSMQANFIQTTYDNKNKAIQKSYGRMALSRPGKFRWQVTQPIPQMIIANQNRLWIYDPDLKQVTIRSLNRAAGEAPALLLSHTNLTLEKDFTVTEQSNNNHGLQWFTLLSKNNDSAFANVQMAFAQNQIKEMRLQDHLGHTTHIQFQNIQTNINLAPALFIFKAPKRVDIINETRE